MSIAEMVLARLRRERIEQRRRVVESRLAQEPPSALRSARRILKDNGDWTRGDARLCAEFVIARSQPGSGA